MLLICPSALKQSTIEDPASLPEMKGRLYIQYLMYPKEVAHKVCQQTKKPLQAFSSCNRNTIDKIYRLGLKV